MQHARDVIEFGEFQFDPAAPLLTRNSHPIDISPRALQILAVLVRNAGQVVGKDELLRLVWPDEFVEEGNLAVHISTLRRVLGESRDAYIETVPKRGYRFARPVSSSTSIVVLPFQNMSPDDERGDGEYFCDGLTEEIINSLTKVPCLKVIARTSAFAFKRKKVDIRHIAETLGVSHVLEGSVRRSGNRIRVTAQLIAAAGGVHLWSERFDRDLAGVFEIQDEISELIAGTLQIKLRPEIAARSRHIPNPAAREALLHAWYHTWKLSCESFVQAHNHFKQAIALDPELALARSGYAEYLFAEAHVGAAPAHELMPLVRTEARKALELDPSLPEAHATLALVAATYDYDWKEAHRQYARAMAGGVSPWTRALCVSFYLLPAGRFEEAVKQGEMALESDPFHLGIRTTLAACLDAAGKVQQAEALILQTLELEPNFPWTNLAAAAHYVLQDRFEKALAFAEKTYSLAPYAVFVVAPLLAGLLLRTGNRMRAEELVQQIRTGPAWSANAGMMYFCLNSGDVDGAADWAEKAIEDRVPSICSALTGQLAKGLRASTRWPKLAKSINLPQIRQEN